MKIKSFSGKYPAEVADIASRDLDGENIISVHPTFDNNNHFCLTVVYESNTIEKDYFLKKLDAKISEARAFIGD